jgi:hypothetical protein
MRICFLIYDLILFILIMDRLPLCLKEFNAFITRKIVETGDKTIKK